KWLYDVFGKSNDAICLLGGGSSSNIWRQILANVLNCEVQSLKQREGVDETVLGAASFACAPNLERDDSLWIRTLPAEQEVARHQFYFDIWIRAVLALQDISFTPPSKL